MKRFITVILALTMVLTMSVPAFAADATEDNEAAAPIAPAPAEMTADQVKAIKPTAKAASYSYTKIKASWGKIEGVDGYKVYRAVKKTGKYSLVKTIANPVATSYINTGRATGKTYWYKVRGYKKIDGKAVYTKYSDIKSAYARPSKVKINKVYLPKDEQVKVTWNKVSGATGYQVYRKRVDKTTWKLFKTVSGKYTSATDKLLGNASKPFGPGGETWYDHADMKYIWEYKVRAYRAVNGKKVYGLFSVPKQFVPEWTIEEIYEELWKYGESLEWPMYEVVSTYPEPDENGDYIKKKTDGSTYHLKHVVGVNEEIGDYIYTNAANGNTTFPSDSSKLDRWTEKNSSWGVGWPCQFNKYDKKTSILKMLKSQLKIDFKYTMASNPIYWDPLWDYTGGGYSGIEMFSIYYKYDQKKACYNVWGVY